jgi:hypothetical protein
MNGSWMRYGAISCAIACGLMIAGPGIAGSAVASAILGIGGDGILDIFGDDDHKRSARHPSQADVGASSPAAGITADGPTSTIGVTRVESGAQPKSTFASEVADDGVPQSSGVDRATNLPLSTAPTTREAVTQAEPPAAVRDSGVPLAPVPAFVPPVSEFVPPVPEFVPPAPEIVPPAPPVIVPPAIVLPPAPVVVPPGAPAGRPEPPASPIPMTQEPRANNPLAPPESFGPNPIPDSFRVGYPEYLRAATVPDLMVLALPGVAGMTLLTAAGGALGFRQARAAAQAALVLTPAAARFVQ